MPDEDLELARLHDPLGVAVHNRARAHRQVEGDARRLPRLGVFGFDGPNAVTGTPLGLVCRGYAADMLLLDPSSWQVRHVWCAGRRQR